MSLQPNDDRSTIRRSGHLQAVFGKVSILLILLIALVLGPIVLIRLNEAWDWPRWQIPAGRVIGGGLMVGVVAVWLYSSHLFSRTGKGTPFITEPPRHLVTTGLYRYSRNPIYVADVAFLFVWFLGCGCLTVLLYTGLAIAFIQAWIIWWEEPGLRKRFGEDYAQYVQNVPRWLFMRSHRKGAE